MDFIHRLPYEIKQHILSYSYNCQDIDLRKDIKSYVATKEILYSNYWEWHFSSSFFRHFIVNDLHVMFTIEDMYFLFIVLPTKRKILNFLHNVIHFLPTNTQINIMWGLMSCEQRLQFLTNNPRYR